MIEMQIHPHVGIGPILLGALRINIRNKMILLGYPLSLTRNAIDYFCENAIQVEYIDDTASFIGVAPHAEIECIFNDVDVFDTEASDLFKIIATVDSSPNLEFDPCEYCFPSLIITLWEADTQYHREGTKEVYGQIGIGDQRYLEAIKNI